MNLPKKVNEVDVINESLALLQKDLNIEPASLLPTEGKELDFDELKRRLADVVAYLLNHDFNRLINALYRIDINEKKLAFILEIENPDQIAPSLAELILEREKKKAITRLAYRDWE